MNPTWIGSRRIWNAFTPTIAPAMRSRTYAFMPWITATTATRNPTDTMIPSSVKKERSLWLHAVWSAWRIASERGMGLELNGKRETGNGKRWVDTHVSRFPLPVSRLFVPQCLDGIESRRLVGGIQPESDPGERGRGEGREHGPQRHVRGDRRQAGDRERDDAARQHADGAPHQREGRGLDEELPLDGPPGGPERLAHADLACALGDRNHHDRDHPDAAHHQRDGREHQHHQEEHAGDLAPGVEQLVLGDDREVVLLPRLEPAQRAQRSHDPVHRLLLRVRRPRG